MGAEKGDGVSADSLLFGDDRTVDGGAVGELLGVERRIKIRHRVELGVVVDYDNLRHSGRPVFTVSLVANFLVLKK